MDMPCLGIAGGVLLSGSKKTVKRFMFGKSLMRLLILLVEKRKEQQAIHNERRTIFLEGIFML